MSVYIKVIRCKLRVYVIFTCTINQMDSNVVIYNSLKPIKTLKIIESQLIFTATLYFLKYKSSKLIGSCVLVKTCDWQHFSLYYSKFLTSSFWLVVITWIILTAKYLFGLCWSQNSLFKWIKTIFFETDVTFVCLKPIFKVISLPDILWGTKMEQ